MSDAARREPSRLPRLRRSAAAPGFAVAPEQTMALLAAIELLGPRGIGDIRRAALATLAPPPERCAEFDALFDAHFLGALRPGLEAEPSDEEPPRAADDSAGGPEPIFGEDTQESGAKATARRDACGAPLRARQRGRDAAPLRPRPAGAPAAAARLSTARRARRPERRHAAHVSRGHAQCRRVHPHAPAQAPAAASAGLSS